ncbi:MAG: nicotinate-nucleotide--dimethylbenzimidazole phosphoribosyltransferase [Bacteroidaceae bacterium]|nr:nicotinate-nucleotide--dimethylbenzimidazole phosphoribosyltransferase [Bacteroidaceae bacterium]
MIEAIDLTEKIDNLNKPKGSLGRLEEIALQIGLVQGTLSPTLTHPCHLLLGADHGIEQEGVSVSPREVTWQQMVNFSRGGGGVNMFCRQHHFDLAIVDVGVDHDLSTFPTIINRKVRAHGSGNFLHEPAMTKEEMERCISIGRELVDDCFHKGSNIISIGEMGIGNTSPSSLWMHLLLDIPLEQCVGAGAGLNTDGIKHKLYVLKQCLKRVQFPLTPQQIMQEFGGLEMVTAVGAMLQATERRMIILVDGFIMSACALMTIQLCPEVKQCAIFCHVGDESGHKKMLERMGVKPLLSLGLRLGEGTGALCAYPIVESAVRMINEMNNFQDAKITKYF